MLVHFTKKTLPNGLRFIAAPMKDTKAVTILMMVGAGSRYEDARTNGVAHFLEHMFFKGTHNRPSTLDITKQLDALGADYNAFTGEEYTGFYVRVAGDDFHEAFDIITDMLLNPLFVDEEIEREKGVIVEELNMYEDTPRRAVNDYAKALLYGDTPLGRNIGGKKDTVTKFTRQDFLDFRKKFYQPDNLVVVIAGNGDETKWQAEVDNTLGSLSGMADKGFEAVNDLQSAPALRLKTKKTDQTHIIAGFRAFPRTDERRGILRVMNNIFGGTMSSRLFTEVRERRGLAYYVRGDAWFFRDAGAFLAAAGVQVDKVDEAITVILDEFRRFRDVLVTDEELERAKKNLRGSLYLNLEDSMSIADFIAEQELYEGHILQPEELIKEAEVVTREQIQELAKSLLKPEAMNLTVLGPYEDVDRFKKLIV